MMAFVTIKDPFFLKKKSKFIKIFKKTSINYKINNNTNIKVTLLKKIYNSTWNKFILMTFCDILIYVHTTLFLIDI